MWQKRNEKRDKRLGEDTKSRLFTLQFFRQIKTRLIIGFLLPVCCIVALGVISYKKASTVIVKNYEKSLSQTLDMTGQYFTFSLKSAQSQVNKYYTNTDVNDYYKGLFKISKTKEIQFFNATVDDLKQIIWSDELINNIYILSKDNKSMTTTDVSDDGLYEAFMNSNQGLQLVEQPDRYIWFGSNNEMDASLKSDSTNNALRVARKYKNTNTCIIADVNKKAVIETLNRLELGKGSLLSLITEDGVELTKDIGEESNQYTSLFYGTDYYKEALLSEKTSDFTYINLNQKDYMFVYSKVGDTGILVCALVPNENIIGQVTDIKNITLLIVIIACILAMLIGTLIAGDISNVIKNLTRVLKKAADGDFTVKFNLKRKDEFGILAEELSNMISHVKILIQEVKVVGNALYSEANQVADTSKVFLESTDNIKLAINEIEAGIIQLDENSADCMGQMDALSSKISLVTDNTTQISSITDTTSKTIDEGILIMDQLNEKTKSTTEIMGTVIDTIEVLEKKSKNIGNIVEVINTIAEQTNLLSLNASIESARAGIYGQGFGVVAEEIRKLADQSLQAASQIHVIIEEIIGKTKESFHIVKLADSIVSQQEVAVHNTTTNFHAMDKQIGMLMNELKSILNNIQNMEQARIKTSEAVMSISAVSEETTACSNTVNETALHQTTAAVLLNTASSELLSRANQLEEAINQFTI